MRTADRARSQREAHYIACGPVGRGQCGLTVLRVPGREDKGWTTEDKEEKYKVDDRQ